MEFENPEYDRDDIGKCEVGTHFVDEEEFHGRLTNQYGALEDLTGNTLEEHKNNVVKLMVKRFYEKKSRTYEFWWG